jgi:molybdopterin/thiamine biosynthesis adenylyltransferase
MINFKRNNIVTNEVLDIPVYIFGVGAVGSHVTRLMTLQGFKNINLSDFDGVEEHNITNQSFTLANLGQNKAKAMQTNMKFAYNIHVNVLEADEEFLAESLPKVIVFNCIDDFDARIKIEAFLMENESIEDCLYIETGLSRSSFQVYAKNDVHNLRDRDTSLVEDTDPTELSLCGGRLTLGHMVYQVAGRAVEVVADYYTNNVTSIKGLYLKNDRYLGEEIECSTDSE